MNITPVIQRLNKNAAAVDYWTARIVVESGQRLQVRNDVLEAPGSSEDAGIYISVIHGDGHGYAATSDMTDGGIRQAFEKAGYWAKQSNDKLDFAVQAMPRLRSGGGYESPVLQEWESTSLANKLDLLRESCASLRQSDLIVDRSAWLSFESSRQYMVSSDGVEIDQHFHWLFPGLHVIANRGSVTQSRSGGGAKSGRQGGLEVLENFAFGDSASLLTEQAVELLDAPQCPDDEMDLLLYPDQMLLQLHESIGHPLELDRILGDERNYAGGSFVTSDMFGNYRYGSELLNVSFDPEVTGELASYAFDDEGSAAQRQWLIRNGKLERPLGSALSQARSGLDGVANARACSWNRPPIDRMANINIEPGESSMDALVAGMERGVIMQTNRSWSIDDQRNKFQFGCEIGWQVEDGEIKQMVRNPNYRGISADFWTNLKGVGDAQTWEASGVPNCGKGEPNQMVYVGHAAPACLFSDVSVFGGVS